MNKYKATVYYRNEKGKVENFQIISYYYEELKAECWRHEAERVSV